MAILNDMLDFTDISCTSFANARQHTQSHLAIILDMVQSTGPDTSTVLRRCRCRLLLTDTFLHLLRCLITATLLTAAALCNHMLLTGASLSRLVCWLTSAADCSWFLLGHM